MILNWIAYTYDSRDGYGRYSARMIQALRHAGVDVRFYTAQQVSAPEWMRWVWGFDPSHLTISCLPPYYAVRVDGPHWMLTMTEGSRLPEGWDGAIYNANATRVIVPSEYNAAAIREACPDLPVHVIHGGTDPQEFPLRNGDRAKADEPYTFLCLADRGARKGWCEVYEAFWQAFGRQQDTPDVKLIIKARPVKNPMLALIAGSDAYDAADPVHVQLYEHIEIWREDVESPAQMFARCDVAAIPSYSEGWGMPHREAAMMGVPTITQRYSGLDDGHTHEWSLPVEHGYTEEIPWAAPHIEGEWKHPDVNELAGLMRWCYDNRQAATERAVQGAQWLRQNQTWRHSCLALIDLIEEYA